MQDSNEPLTYALIPAGFLTRIIHTKQNIILNYEALLGFAMDKEDAQIIDEIISDEKHHLALFKKLYEDFFSTPLEPFVEPSIKVSSFLEGLLYGIRSEFDTYGLYGSILFSEKNEEVLSTFRRAVFDENIHSSKYIYLYGKLTKSLFE